MPQCIISLRKIQVRNLPWRRAPLKTDNTAAQIGEQSQWDRQYKEGAVFTLLGDRALRHDVSVLCSSGATATYVTSS